MVDIAIDNIDNYSFHGVSKPTNITGGSHPALIQLACKHHEHCCNMMFFCMVLSTTIWSKTGVNLLLQLPSGNLLQFAIENGPV